MRHISDFFAIGLAVVSLTMWPLAALAAPLGPTDTAPGIADAANRAERAGHEAARAESRASKAEESADTAKDSAHAAVEKAETAKDTAKSAEKKADTAQDQSQNAVKEAEAASSAAKKAAEGATLAVKKADAAVAKANEAEATAGEAVPKAREEARKTAESVSSVTVPSNRVSHIIGAYMSLWGDPYPTTVGFNVAYNAYDFVRLSAGVGSDDASVFKATTAGVGAKVFMPGWNFSPTVGLNLSFSKLDNDSRARSVKGFAPSGATPYVNMGFDWESGLGFNFGVGYVQPLRASLPGSWYFDAGIFL